MNVPNCPNCNQHGSDVPQANVIAHVEAHVIHHRDSDTNQLYTDHVPQHYIWQCVRCGEHVGAYKL